LRKPAGFWTKGKGYEIVRNYVEGKVDRVRAIALLREAGCTETLGKTDDASIGKHLLDWYARDVRNSLDLPSNREAAQQERARPMGFWSLDDLDLTDSLNRDIWTLSPEEQDRIQPYRSNWVPGEIGAQQAMRHPYRLPWVPDLVGRDWQNEDAVVIFGSAYGAFIGREDRPSSVAPHRYAGASSAAEFTKLFFDKVVPDRYYARIAELASTIVPSCRLAVVLDLCRVAFVRRLVERDKGGDGVVSNAPELFARYVESAVANDWLWRRVLGTKAETIVALGKVAEHGVLRLFASNLREVSIRDSSDANIRFPVKPGDHRWPRRSAHPKRTLKHRVEAGSPPYWAIEGRTSDGTQRAWCMAVVPHPTGAWRPSFTTYPTTSALRVAYRCGRTL